MSLLLRVRSSWFIFALASAASPTLTVAQETRPGSYRFWLCAELCTAADSATAVAQGTFVLILGEPTENEALALLQLRQLRGQAPPNACFSIARRSTRVHDEELFAGIIPAGATRWKVREPGGASIVVYQSVDAIYELRWIPNETGVLGEGWSTGWQSDVGWHRNAYLVALRTGPPNVRDCLR